MLPWSFISNYPFTILHDFQFELVTKLYLVWMQEAAWDGVLQLLLSRSIQEGIMFMILVCCIELAEDTCLELC